MLTHRWAAGGGLAVAAMMLALALLGPVSAEAKHFRVTTKIGIYAQPNVSQGLSTVPANGTVDVQCWTKARRFKAMTSGTRSSGTAGRRTSTTSTST